MRAGLLSFYLVVWSGAIMDTGKFSGVDPPLVNDPTLVRVDPPLVKRACNRRGITPRNVSPQKRSTRMQVGCQLDTIKEKVAHHQKNMVTRSTFDVECINYADDEVETYKDEVTRCLYDKVKCGNGSYASTKHLVNIESVTELVN